MEYPPKRITQKRREKVVETIASGEDGKMKAQGRKESGGEGRKGENMRREGESNEAQEEKRIQEERVVEEMHRFTTKIFKREEEER